MSHSPDLIRRIVGLLQNDYPPSEYTFVTEKAIAGTRMLPDIQIFDFAGKLVCVVEIGYTRPEKLTAYRHKLRIPDVRWYDKNGKLHADVQERVVRVTIDTQPRGTVYIYELHDQTECRSEDCERDAVMEWNMAVQDIPEPMTEQEDLDLWDEVVLNSLCAEVDTFLVTDYSRVWLFSFCDKCGAEWVSQSGDSITLLAAVGELPDLSAVQFARAWGKRVFRGDWKDAVQWIEGRVGESLVYEDGAFLSNQAQRAWRKSVVEARLDAARML